MKLTRLRLFGIIVAALVLGTVALAVAVDAQSPAASQIPTVVTHQATATPAPHALVATATASASSTAIKPVSAKPESAKPKSDAEATDHSSSSQREVVTPKLRDDGDGDEDGAGNNDGDSDNAGSSGTGGTKASSAQGSSTKSSQYGRGGSTHSSGRAKGQDTKSAPFGNTRSGTSTHVRTPVSRSTKRLGKPTRVRARRSSGKNVGSRFRN
ncbi:MAG: hypothetical protein P4L93_08450 [Coriobacteriia bacterium]|nr:hypothetical protein [Coriobacteriia bacterium]